MTSPNENSKVEVFTYWAFRCKSSKDGGPIPNPSLPFTAETVKEAWANAKLKVDW